MKLFIVAAILVSSSASAARVIQCQAVKIDKPVAGEIHSIKEVSGFSAELERTSASAIVTRSESGAVSGAKIDVYHSEGFGEESICGYQTSDVVVNGQLHSYSSCLVKKNPEKRAQAQWVLRRSLRIQTTPYCLPNEDYQCTSEANVIEERAMLCSDSADTAVAAPSSTQEMIESDPCSPNYKGRQ